MRMRNLLKLFLAFVMVAGVALASSPTADAKMLALVNKTGRDIIVFNCSPTTSSSWHDDVLGDDIWPNGSTVTIDFDRWELAKTWDFQVHYSDGDSEDWRNVNVQEVDTIILHPNGRNEFL